MRPWPLSSYPIQLVMHYKQIFSALPEAVCTTTTANVKIGKYDMMHCCSCNIRTYQISNFTFSSSVSVLTSLHGQGRGACVPGCLYTPLSPSLCAQLFTTILIGYKAKFFPPTFIHYTANMICGQTGWMFSSHMVPTRVHNWWPIVPWIIAHGVFAIAYNLQPFTNRSHMSNFHCILFLYTVLGRAATWRTGFVNYFLRVPLSYCSCAAARAN